jgi:hypothetical protein
MIFIGAGVPVAFGIPPLIEMTKTIRKNISSSNGAQASQISLVSEQLEKLGFPADIENVLSVLEAMRNPNRIFQEVGPKIAALQYTGPVESITPIDPLVEAIKMQIKSLCSSPDYQKAVDFYRSFIQKVSNMPRYAGGEDMGRFKSIIVTTNYDITIEEALKAAGVVYYDGFSAVDGRDERVFSSNWPQVSGLGYNVNLVKLHGSIDYYKEPDGAIIKDRSLSRLGMASKRVELLVYPAGEKSITSTPFYDLYSMFRAELFKRTRAVALGFSFRDFAIRNIFSDWLSLDPRARLILYARNASRNRSLFPENVRSQVISEDKDFSDPNFIDSLQGYTRSI